MTFYYEYLPKINEYHAKKRLSKIEEEGEKTDQDTVVIDTSMS